MLSTRKKVNQVTFLTGNSDDAGPWTVSKPMALSIMRMRCVECFLKAGSERIRMDCGSTSAGKPKIPFVAGQFVNKLQRRQ